MPHKLSPPVYSVLGSHGLHAYAEYLIILHMYVTCFGTTVVSYESYVRMYVCLTDQFDVSTYLSCFYSAIIEHTNRVIYLEDDDVAAVGKDGSTFVYDPSPSVSMVPLPPPPSPSSPTPYPPPSTPSLFPYPLPASFHTLPLPLPPTRLLPHPPSSPTPYLPPSTPSLFPYPLPTSFHTLPLPLPASFHTLPGTAKDIFIPLP